jgi:hypothetical protein
MYQSANRKSAILFMIYRQMANPQISQVCQLATLQKRKAESVPNNQPQKNSVSKKFNKTHLLYKNLLGANVY